MLKKIQAPVAAKKPVELVKHDDIRIDDYFWLNDRENPEVIDYLTKENVYYQESTKHTKEFQDALFLEMKSRIKEDDESVPYFYNGYFYITRFETNKGYPIYARRKGTLSAPEEILFDCNQMAEGQSFFNLSGVSISRDNKFATFAVDTQGRRIYTIGIKNLETGEILEDQITNATGNCVWANDNKTIFYSRQDEVTLRHNAIYKHIKGSDASSDKLVYLENDETFNVSVSKEKSRKYLVISSTSTLTSEQRILLADKPNGKFKVFQRRNRGVEYGISHFEDRFYILTNKDKATNFKVMVTPEDATSKENWVDVIPHNDEVLIEGLDIFKDFLVIEERSKGLNHIRIRAWQSGEEYYLPFENETYSAFTMSNIDFETDILRYGYQSLATPSSVIDFNMKTKTKTILKEQQILDDNFHKANYIEKRVWATAKDGVQIPISMVYRKDMIQDGKNPLLLYAYGSYGASMDPYFSSTRLSLLNRGFIYAIAHIRGGEDMGRHWYETGKLLKKKNTFTDFIDCTKFLIDQKYSSPQHLYAEGGSAGGLLIGAVINIAPELYNGVIAQVPFVDVVTTMLDDTIPLTTGEYDEWGDPNSKRYYNYMKSYSPYDNIKKMNYPNMYVSTGLHDSQVQYWEPAKWVAKLREYKTDDNLLLLDINMDAGHGGASGRFEALKELAKEFCFLFDLEKITS